LKFYEIYQEISTLVERLNEKNLDGETPFLIACLYRNVEIVKILMNTKGFNSLNEKDDEGQTPFLISCHDGNKEIVKMIMKSKDFNSLNDSDNLGGSPFIFAYYHNHVSIIEELLKQPNIIVPKWVASDDKYDEDQIEYLILSYKKDPPGYQEKLNLKSQKYN
jgi:ankyrin repeat protein